MEQPKACRSEISVTKVSYFSEKPPAVLVESFRTGRVPTLKESAEINAFSSAHSQSLEIFAVIDDADILKLVKAQGGYGPLYAVQTRSFTFDALIPENTSSIPQK